MFKTWSSISLHYYVNVKSDIKKIFHNNAKKKNMGKVKPLF